MSMAIPGCAFGADDTLVRLLRDDERVVIQGRDGEREAWTTWSKPYRLGDLRQGTYVTRPAGRDFNFCRLVPERGAGDP